jgi:hypothetical protein
MEEQSMFKVKLSEPDPTILTFDGEILECFFADGSKRFHISHIKGFQLEPNNKGKYLLTIKLLYDPVLLWADEAGVAKMKALIAEVQTAIAAYNL